MNQDFTEKKALFVWKKIRAEGFTWKKNSCSSSEQKKKFLQPENSPPPHHFSNGPSLMISKCGSPVESATLPVTIDYLPALFKKMQFSFTVLWFNLFVLSL